MWIYQLKALDNFFDSSLDNKLNIWLIRLSQKTQKEHQWLATVKNPLEIYENNLS